AQHNQAVAVLLGVECGVQGLIGECDLSLDIGRDRLALGADFQDAALQYQKMTKFSPVVAVVLNVSVALGCTSTVLSAVVTSLMSYVTVVPGLMSTMSPLAGRRPSDQAVGSDQLPLLTLTIVGAAPKLGIFRYGVVMNGAVTGGGTGLET